MSYLKLINNKILLLEEISNQVNEWKQRGNKIVFTNGCFDILHRGHIEVLMAAANHGEKLIVGLNSDKSIKKIKATNRPVNNENHRAVTVASLACVDAVVIFEETTPIKLIKKILPDILVKGGDYQINTIVGSSIVKETGGEIITIPLIDGISTSDIIKKIKKM